METEDELRARHRQEWLDIHDILQEAIAQADVDKAKLAKLLAETLKIRQEGERRAWGIDAKTAPQDDGPLDVCWDSG